MVFSSIIFLTVFLPCVGILYYLVPKWMRNAVLLLFSLLFYAWGEPRYLFLMIGSILIHFMAGLLLERTQSPKRKKAVLVSAILLNLGTLAVFKYERMILNGIEVLTGQTISFMALALPIGISFYTFQAMSYLIDVYRGKTGANHHILSFATYIAMFPQLIAGPIVRYETVQKELDDREETWEDLSEGLNRFVVGLGKKVLLANSFGSLWDEIRLLDGSSLSTADAWIGLVAFSLQIYFDFSGYSDMAIGLGRMFGFHFSENFQYPYESKSITEFWRRWHISLGSWFREYVYIPMGGNRRGVARQMVNLLAVWMLTGLWHGASMNFVLWGIYYAFFLILEKVFLGKVLVKIPKIFSWLYTMFVVVIGWGIFSIVDMKKPLDFFAALFPFLGRVNGVGLIHNEAVYRAISYSGVWVLGAVSMTSLMHRLMQKSMKRFPYAVKIAQLFGTAALLLLCIACIVSDTYNPFLYFRF